MEEHMFGSDMMSPISTGVEKFTRMFMAFMEDTGWYKSNYCKAEQYSYGKDEGCGFYDEIIN